MATTPKDEQDTLADMVALKARCQRRPHPCEVIGEVLEQLADACARIEQLEAVLCRASRCIDLQLQLIDLRAQGATLQKLPIVRSLEVHKQSFDQVLATSRRGPCRAEGGCHA